MLIWTGLRRVISAIQRLFNSASFYAPLTHSLVPERGTGSPTFTRASTATFTDWEGVLRTVPSGCARFEGGRMVRNLLTFTEDFSNAAWVKYRAPVMTYSQPAPDGTNTATKVAPTLVGGTNAGVYASAVTGTGRTLITSFYVKPSNWTWIQINKQDGNNGVWFNLVAGTVGTQSAGTTGAIEALDDGWFRCSIVSASAATSYSEIAIVDGDNTTATTGNSVDGIFIWHPQLEDVTGQADQTASEYVSVGVPSDWAGPEYVSNGTFDSDTTGWTAVNSTLSVVSGKLRVTNVGANAGYCHQAITTVVGQKYVLSASVTQQTSSTYSIYIGNSPGSGALGGLGTAASVEFTATATTTYLSPINTQAVDGRYTDFDNISVKPAAYHGSMVDGVKCFPTDLAGNALTTMLGYLAEGARTNQVKHSQDYTNAVWVLAAGVAAPAANQYVAPDGTTTMDAVGPSAGGTFHYFSQTGLSLSAGSSTFSTYVRYVNHRWLAIVLNDTVTEKYASFDLLNGTAGAVTAGATSTISATPFAGVYRITITLTTAATASGTIYHSFNNADLAGLSSWAAAGTEVVGLWGAQVELGSFATPYQPTTTVAVARNADVDQYPTTDGPIAAAGSIALDFTPYHAPSGTIALWGTYVDASNYTAILHDATNLIFRKRIAGSNYDATIANAFVSGTTYKVAATWGAAGTAIYLDGVAGTPHANTTAAQIAATMQVGADGNSLQQPGAGTTNLRIWQRQLSSPEGVAVTA